MKIRNTKVTSFIKSISLIIIMILFFNRLTAQQTNDYDYFDNVLNRNMNIVDTSVPDVKGLQRYNLSSAQEYSGKINISIPIFNIKAGNISYPISINYNSGGIKIADEASRVGLGWSLSNSFIVRKIMDGHDWDESGKTESETVQAVNDCGGQCFDLNSSVNKRLGYFKYKSTNAKLHRKLAKIDLLPDIYNVYIPSGNSSFYFETHSNPIELTTNEIKISSTTNTINFIVNGTYGSAGHTTLPSKDFFSFQIKDNNGIIYDFNDYDVASHLTYAPLSDAGLNVPNVSTWHITKMTDPSTSAVIDFEYEDVISALTKVEKKHLIRRATTRSLKPTSIYQGIFRYTTFQNGNSVPLVHDFEHDPNFGAGAKKVIMTNYTEYYKIKRLKKIIFPEGYLTFHYNFQRQDNSYDNKALSQIKLFDYNHKLIKEFSLVYNYFECNSLEGVGTDPYNCKRLKLSSIQESGYPPYKFEYIEDIGLPRKNSRAFDFLGYYNGQHSAYFESNGPNYTIPTLYYYPNKGAWSVLPFEFNHEDHYVIKDDENYSNLNRKSSFNHTKQATLRQISFPSGGYEKFEYELNNFKVFREDVEGGGLRIKKQIINDNKGNETFINYRYINDEINQSSGQLIRPPMFGFPQGTLFYSYYELNPYDQEDPPGEIITDYQGLPNWDYSKIYNYFFITDNNLMDIDINNSSYVGYKQVNKIYSDGSYDKLIFTSRSDHPDKRGFGFFGYDADIGENKGEAGSENGGSGFFDQNITFYSFDTYGEFLQTNSNYEGNLYTDFSRDRGKPISVYKYDVNNRLRKKTEYEYEKKIFTTNKIFQKPLYSASLSHGGFYSSSVCCITAYISYGTARIFYNTSRFKPSSIKETEYLDSSSGIKEHITEQKFIYLNQPPSNRLNSVSHSLYQPHGSFPYGVESQYWFEYADNPNPPYNNSAIASLRANNILSKPIVINKGKGDDYGGFLIQKKINKYVKDGSTSNLPLIGNVEIQTGETFNVASYKYDNKGNVMEYTLENGTPVSIVWGYKQLYPIAKIEGISYSSIPTTLITNAVTASLADNDSGYGAVKENALRSRLNEFRTNSTLVNANVLITTYTYDPLIGLTSVTNPIGLTSYYKYDENGRLEKVIDENGKELQGVEYNIPTP